MSEHTLSGDAGLVLPEFDEPPADPLALLHRWLTEAEAAGVREARAMALATANADGEVTVRTVLLKDVDATDLLLSFSAESRKGRDIAENPRVAVNLYWRERLQQVNVRGTVQPCEASESDALFAERPRAAQAASAASQQSAPLPDAEALQRRFDEILAQPGAIRRPESWSGWRLRPHTIEFWHGAADRMHRRLMYSHGPAGWHSHHLQP